MPLNSNSIKYDIGDSSILSNMESVPALIPFDKTVLDYLNDVSKLLFANIESKQYPDVLTFAFWCRKASIKSLQQPYEGIANRIGRGIAFHIAPSNVAVNFAYSLVAGLLAGNANIIRLPSKDFPQVGLICDALHEALKDNIRPYLCMIRYEHNKEVTDYLSGICDTRIIWGGDETIATIRKSAIKPRTTEITFADRYSICIIDADVYLEAKDKKSIALDFYNDTFLTDQNACTSPRLVIWLGDKIDEAKTTFWDELRNPVKARYSLQPVQAVNKLANLYRQAVSGTCAHLSSGMDNRIMRVQVESISGELMECKGNSGYFMEYDAKKIEEILPLLHSQCQTLSYYGLDSGKLQEFILNAKPRGIDRIVPIGKTMDFSLVWDGYDLIRSLSREISIC